MDSRRQEPFAGMDQRFSIRIFGYCHDCLQHAGDRERCIQAGMNDFIAKSFQKRVLAGILARWLK
jgi:hypothetical protein